MVETNLWDMVYNPIILTSLKVYARAKKKLFSNKGIIRNNL